MSQNWALQERDKIWAKENSKLAKKFDVQALKQVQACTVITVVITIFTVTRKLTRLRRRIGLQVKLFLLNLYVVGSLPCILKSNWIGLQVKLGRGEREREMNS